MSKRILIAILVLAAVIVGAVAVYALTRPNDPAPTQTPAAESPGTAESESPESTPTTPPTVSPGAYVEYSETAIAEAEGTTLLFFHAAWCPQCRAIEGDIDAEGVPDGVTIIKVDYDSHQDLRQQYGVTLQTTFVEVTADGSKVQKFVAYDDPRLQAVLDAML